jgi:hypothetical protein
MRELLTAVILLASPLALVGQDVPPGKPGKALFRYWVFEASPEVLDRLIPREKQTPIEGSQHVLAKLPAGDKSALLKCANPEPGLLAQRERLIAGWPRVADTWASSRAADGLLGGSTGAGFLGVREKDDLQEVRIDYEVLHTINTTNALKSKLLHEGPCRPGGLRVFLAPFQRDDGTRLYHVVAFEIVGPDGEAVAPTRRGRALLFDPPEPRAPAAPNPPGS